MQDEHLAKPTEQDDAPAASAAEAPVSEPQAAQPPDGTDAASDEAPAESPDELRRQRDDYYDRLLRATAEFDNFRKRTDRELAEHAARGLLADLLPIVDDLERALAAEADDGEVYRRGVEIIYKQLLELLSRHGVAPIEALGAEFDPNLHQAVMHEPSETHRDGEIVEEMRRGYMLRDRLLRAAMVKVAKA